MTQPDKELLKKSKELDRVWLTIPEDKIFMKRTVVIGFVVVVLSICLSFGITAWQTNRAVKHEIPGLKQQIADQKETISDQESIINQETDAILLLSGILTDHGIQPPEIVIKPED